MEFPEGVAVVRLTRIAKPQTETFAAARGKVEREVRNAKKLELLHGAGRRRWPPS